MIRYFFVFNVYYRCVVDTLVYTSDYYDSYEECLAAAKECEDDDHFITIERERGILI